MREFELVGSPTYLPPYLPAVWLFTGACLLEIIYLRLYFGRLQQHNSTAVQQYHFMCD